MGENFQISVRGHFFQFHTGEGIFSKGHLDPGTRLLAENMILPPSGRVLDLGCGYGAIGIIAAKLNQNLQVILTDNNHLAIRLAKVNTSLNRLKNVETRLGDNYEPVHGEYFNLIVTNPPLSAGFSTVSAMIIGAKEHLYANCVLQLVVRKGFEMIASECDRVFGNVEVLARGSGYRVFHSELAKP